MLDGATFGAGMVGQAFSFNGGTSQVVAPDSPNLDITTAVTLDAWVNPASLANCPRSFCAVVAKGNWPASRNYGLFIRGDRGVGTGYVTTGGTSIFANTTTDGLVPEGSFTHVAAVINPAAGEISIYVNGVSQPVSISGGSPSSPLLADNEPLRIGFSDPGGFKHNFNGIIDEVEIFNRALAGAEVEDIVMADSAGKCTMEELTSLSPATLWVGLKNSDDQGTQFDVRTEVYINDALVAEGETRCITGVTRNPNKAKEASVPFGPISEGAFGSGDELFLRVLTRIGTKPDDTKCSGHNNAVGLRLYYDAVSRPSRFDAEIPPDPLTDFFLHSVGTDFFLNATPPTATSAKFKDSSAVNFIGGNPWKEIGTWHMILP